jgi:hypothetical protein
VFSGTFTAHAEHPLKFSTGHHQSSFFGFVNEDQGVSIEEAQGLPRLGDGVHKLQFVGEGGH